MNSIDTYRVIGITQPCPLRFDQRLVVRPDDYGGRYEDGARQILTDIVGNLNVMNLDNDVTRVCTEAAAAVALNRKYIDNAHPHPPNRTNEPENNS